MERRIDLLVEMSMMLDMMLAHAKNDNVYHARFWQSRYMSHKEKCYAMVNEMTTWKCIHCEYDCTLSSRLMESHGDRPQWCPIQFQGPAPGWKKLG